MDVRVETGVLAIRLCFICQRNMCSEIFAANSYRIYVHFWSSNCAEMEAEYRAENRGEQVARFDSEYTKRLKSAEHT